MRLALAAAAALLAVAPRAGRAQPVLGLRLAVAPAAGSAVDELPMADALRLQFPIQLDALWSFGSFAAGAYGSWGIATVGGCEGSCGGSVARVGIQALWTFPRSRGAEPWVGGGAGYEWATERRERGGNELTRRWRGFELFSIQGGAEWQVARAIAVGPFVLVGAGRYTDVKLDTDVDSGSAGIAVKALHAWIHLGVRARLALGEAR